MASTSAMSAGKMAMICGRSKVARIDRKTGVVSDFIAHPSNDPVTIFAPAGVNKPIDVHFRRREMFVVDFGVGAGAPKQIPNSGKIWKVTNLVKQAGDHEGNEAHGEH